MMVLWYTVPARNGLCLSVLTKDCVRLYKAVPQVALNLSCPTPNLENVPELFHITRLPGYLTTCLPDP
jgi:hypothetical protein